MTWIFGCFPVTWKIYAKLETFTESKQEISVINKTEDFSVRADQKFTVDCIDFIPLRIKWTNSVLASQGLQDDNIDPLHSLPFLTAFYIPEDS